MMWYHKRQQAVKKRRSKTMNKIAVVSCGVILLSSLVYYNFIDRNESYIVYEVGERCPTKLLKKYNSSDYYSIEQSRDKVTVLNFWATWCGPCIKELPDFEQLYLEYLPTNKVDVIAIHSTKITSNDIEAFINDPSNFKDFQITFAQDESTNSPELFLSLGGTLNHELPMTVIIDQKGIIYEKINGSTNYETLKDKIDLLLAE